MTIELHKTDAEYYLLVNRQELYTRATELGFSDIILLNGIIDTDDIEAMKLIGKSFMLVYFDESGNDNANQMLKMMQESDIAYRSMQGFSFWGWEEDDDEVTTIELAVKQFPSREIVEYMLISMGYIHDTDYTERCGNCHSKMDPQDKYCSICGTKRGDGAFLPFKNAAYVLYGAPIIRTDCKCEVCGNLWREPWDVPQDRKVYCPACGSNNTKKVGYKELLWHDDGGLTWDDVE